MVGLAWLLHSCEPSSCYLVSKTAQFHTGRWETCLMLLHWALCEISLMVDKSPKMRLSSRENWDFLFCIGLFPLVQYKTSLAYDSIGILLCFTCSLSALGSKIRLAWLRSLFASGMLNWNDRGSFLKSCSFYQAKKTRNHLVEAWREGRPFTIVQFSMWILSYMYEHNSTSFVFILVINQCFCILKWQR